MRLYKLVLILTALILCVVFFGALGKCQDIRPRLELEPRLNLNGGGFQRVSGSMTGGLGMEDAWNSHLLWHVSGTYDAARKANDGTTNNLHGNIRSLGGEFGVRTGNPEDNGWIFGAQGSYASLRTTNYDKISWGIGLEGGHDWMRATCSNCNPGQFTSLRLTVLWGLPLRKSVDTEEGFTARLMVPSPIETQRHVFLDVRAFAGWIRTGEHASYTHDASSSLGLLFRF